MNLSPGPKEKLYIQKFYLYMNLTKPSELLYLSLGKSIRGRKSTSSSVSDSGSDASVPGTCSGRGRQKGTA